MKKAVLAARLLLGLVFVVFGLNGFLEFLEPPAMPEPAMQFIGALMDTGYMMPGLVKTTEVAAGVLLLSGYFVPLALILLAPVVVNIVLFHLFLAPSGLPLPIVVLALGIFCAWGYRGAFRGVLQVKTEPT